MKVVASIFGVIAFIGTLVALTVGGRFFSLEMNKFFAPKEENMRREVFKNTQSFVQGKSQMLTKLRYEYSKAEDKEPVKAMVRHISAGLDTTKLTIELEQFVQECNR